MKKKSNANTPESHGVQPDITAHRQGSRWSSKENASFQENQGLTTDVSTQGFLQNWLSFWFTPGDAVGLHTLRVLAGLLFLFWLVMFTGQQDAFFGLGGWFDVTAYRDAARMSGTNMDRLDRFGWSIVFMCGDNPVAVHALYWGALGVLLLFTLGVWTRVTSVLTWVIVVSFAFNPATAFGADFLLIILAFYLMVGYATYGLWSRPEMSTAARILGPRDTFLFAPWVFPRKNDDETPQVSYAANLAIRLLQVHFAIILVTSALHKFQFGDWWAGVAYWYPLHPPFRTTFEQIRSSPEAARSYLFVLSLMQYGVLAWQLTFPLFAWRKSWRIVLLGGAALGWVGNVAILGLPLFGPICVLACLSYLTPEEWRRAVDYVSAMLHSGKALHAPTSNSTCKSAKVGT